MRGFLVVVAVGVVVLVGVPLGNKVQRTAHPTGDCSAFADVYVREELSRSL